MSNSEPNINVTIHCNRHDIEIEVDHAHELDNDWFALTFSLDVIVYLNAEQTAALAQSLLNGLQDHNELVKERNSLNSEASELAQADEGTVPPLGTEL